MPITAKRPCTQPGCGVLVDGGRCEAHRKQHSREQDQQRGSASERGYGRAWQKASKAFLRKHPLCQCPECDEGRKRLMLAAVVDHKVPHRLGEALASRNADATERALKLFWDSSNWQSMSKTCHDTKTAREDGGFRGAG